MGSWRERATLLLVVALTVVLAYLAAPEDGASRSDPRPSSFHSSPEGARALYLTLEALDIPLVRRLTAFAGADSLTGPLALIAPTIPLTPLELDALTEWIEAGGTLLYVARPGDPTLDALGLGELVRLERGSGGVVASQVGAEAPHRWAEGGTPVGGFALAFADTAPALGSADAVPLLQTESGAVVAVTWRRGAGTVVAWSDRAPLVNGALRESGGAVIFARAAAEATRAGEPLAFDEYHHGYRGDGSAIAATLNFLSTTRPGHMTIQLAVAVAGLLLLAGWRFGAPIPPAPALRRSPLEHVDALAELYRQADAHATARRLLLAQFARRIGRTPPRGAAEEADFFEDIAAVHGVDGGARVAAVHAEWRRGDRADLVGLARAMDELISEVKRR
jgi:hypothetical protein